jgi:hypothetical protein
MGEINHFKILLLYTYDVGGMLMRYDLIEYWYGYLTYQKKDLVGHKNIDMYDSERLVD